MILKKHFSLNPFWTSPEILNLPDENIILIAIKNATNLITFYELKELFDIDFIEQVYLKNKNTFSKRTQELIETNLWIIKKEWKKNVKINFKRQEMKKETESVLKSIKDDEFFQKNSFMLVGGTALSLYLKHRISEDLDFQLLDNGKLPKNEIYDFAKRQGLQKIYFDNTAVDFITNEGGDIEELHQRYIKDGVKIEFFIPQNDIPELKNKYQIFYDNVKIATLDYLKIQKSLLLVERTKIRDFYDIAYMLEHKIITPEFILETIHKHKITYEDWFTINYIRIKKQCKDDEGLKSLMDNPPTFNELKEYILEKLSNAVDLKYSQMMKKRKPGY